jgi:hypothetical protein
MTVLGSDLSRKAFLYSSGLNPTVSLFLASSTGRLIMEGWASTTQPSSVASRIVIMSLTNSSCDQFLRNGVLEQRIVRRSVRRKPADDFSFAADQELLEVP